MPTSKVPTLRFAYPSEQDPESLMTKEWLVTNGLGGYASGTLLGVATRRHHGLFVPDLPSPRGRTMIVPRLDEIVETRHKQVQLSGAEYVDGRLEGEGHRVLTEFRREWQTPIWSFDIDGCRIEKRVLMPYGQNTVYVEYVQRAGDPVRLKLRPFVTFRQHDQPLQTGEEGPLTLTVTRGRYEVFLAEGAPSLKMCVRPQGGVFVADDVVSHDVFYRIERDRGYGHVEDLTSPGYFTGELSVGRTLAFVASTEPWELLEFDSGSISEVEEQRLQKVLSLVGKEQDDLEAQLVLAADQFIVFPGSRLEERILARASGDEAKTVIAGYHWFTDWGRDTMISLEGLTICTGRHREARSILRTFSQYIKDGLLPNLFPEGERTGLYHTADATLWYFHALDRYYEATRDRDTLMMLYPILKNVIERHVSGTHFGIGVDPKDGLIKAGAEGYQLTWMDAKVDDWVVTPRRGKPVEIQALWYNALCLMARWAESFGERPDQWIGMAKQAEESFHHRFWYEASGHLYDVIDGEQGDDASLRPNQLFAMSLRYPILSRDRWQSVLKIVTDKLLTPVGLRTLAPGHRDYKAMYFGDLRARDAAYHQGTVWAWLIGHYVDAWLKVHGDKQQARAMLNGFKAHLLEAGIGTISEIFDAETPYAPRGCIAQAWSVAEVLRAYQNTK